ncbi:MAG: S41 family peptidase [Chlorobi bacterium]|nr:S41 family peptidase [Chlorobiota bacterium]
MKRGFRLIALLAWLSVPAQHTDYFEWGKQMEIYAGVIRQLLDNYIEEPDPATLNRHGLKAMLRQTDRYTSFYDEDEMFEQRLKRSGEISGIGVAVKNKEKGLSIREVLLDSPAREAGLAPGDLITAIDGRSLDSLSYRARLKLLKGKPGTRVQIRILRRNRPLTFTVERRIIRQKAVPHYRMLDDRTGYIRLARFTDRAGTEVLDAFMELKNRGMERLVLDLRGNPGGLLSQAVETAGLFIPKGSLVVSTKGRMEKFNKTYRTRHTPVDTEIPLVILTDKKSASASEIVAGTLQDYDRAVIVGDTTFGKGLVQRFFPLPYGSYLKITISKYYLPSGRQIQKTDYWHRDAKGRALRYRRDTTRIFYTSGKRKVYEHGGITPDVTVRPAPLHPLLKDLQKRDILFDFNTDFYWNHPEIRRGDDIPGATLLAEFFRYLDKHRIDPRTPAEIMIEKSLDSLTRLEGYDDIRRRLEEVSRSLDQSDTETLRYDMRVMQRLTDLLVRDLIRRYEGGDAAYRYKLEEDPVVREAKAILSGDRWARILGKR